MEFAGDITKKDIQDLVDNLVYGDIYHQASSLNCEVTVTVDDDFTPHISIETDDEFLTVDVKTEVLYREGVAEGWEFIPTITNTGLSQMIDIYSVEDVVSRFKYWSDVAKMCQKIYERDIYPYDYFD